MALINLNLKEQEKKAIHIFLQLYKSALGEFQSYAVCTQSKFMLLLELLKLFKLQWASH